MNRQLLFRHLRANEGGTRAFGNHLRSFKPNHAVGAYYFILRTSSGWQSLGRLRQTPATVDHDTTPPFSAMVDPGDSCRGIIRNGLGTAACGARTSLFESQKIA